METHIHLDLPSRHRARTRFFLPFFLVTMESLDDTTTAIPLSDAQFEVIKMSLIV